MEVAQHLNDMKPIVLAILDGWGLSPGWGGNAIEMQNPDNFNYLWRKYPHMVLKSFFSTSKTRGSLANSEIGHMMIGTGREIMSDCEFIDDQMQKSDFLRNTELLQSIEHAIRYNSDIHLIGMISEGCVHSSYRHLKSLLVFFKRNNFSRVFIHAITDGIDDDPGSGAVYIHQLLQDIAEIGVGRLATVCGRFYAMDRDNHFDRIEKFYRCITGSKIYAKALDAKQAVHQAYDAKLKDENIPATTIIENGFPVGYLKNHDSVILTNFRSDRMRQLVLSLLQIKKYGLFSNAPVNLRISSILKYHFKEYENKNLSPVFPEKEIEKSLPELLSLHHINVLKVAESEKLAHVTYFFNGGRDKPFPGEKRIIIKSADVISFSSLPEMSSAEITSTIVDAVDKNVYGLIVVNYANVDEVAHTGDITATADAVKAVDQALGTLKDLAEKNKVTLIVTADHGNGEKMIGNKYVGQSEAFHTYNPVPFILVDNDLATRYVISNNDILSLVAKSSHSLSDIAPTILEIFRIKKPVEMIGESLLSKLQG